MGFPVFPGIPWGSPPLPDRKGRPGGVGVCTGRRRLTSFFLPCHQRRRAAAPTSRHANADEPAQQRANTPTGCCRRQRATGNANEPPCRHRHGQANTGSGGKPIPATPTSGCLRRCMVSLLFGFDYSGFISGFHLGFIWFLFVVFIGIRGGMVGGREGMGFPPRGRETGGRGDGTGYASGKGRRRARRRADKGGGTTEPHNSTVKQAVQPYKTEGG